MNNATKNLTNFYNFLLNKFLFKIINEKQKYYDCIVNALKSLQSIDSLFNCDCCHRLSEKLQIFVTIEIRPRTFYIKSRT